MKQGLIGRIENVDAAAVTRQAVGRFQVETPGPGFTDMTDAIRRWAGESRIENGLLTVFCRHTSASLTIQENADPDVQRDLMTALDRLAPRNAGYVHDTEGPDDMPSHIRTMLTGASVQVPVVDGRLALGTWQGIYLIEHRDRPHRREIVLHVAGN
jgi:secondary thiamine-phosphate synthase enzyme